MKFNTKYNIVEKYKSELKPIQKKISSKNIEFEPTHLTTNLKKTVFRLQNRDLFDEEIEKIDLDNKKFQVGKFV